MFSKRTGCTVRTTAGTSPASPLTEKLIEMPHILLLSKYPLTKMTFSHLGHAQNAAG